MDNRTRNPNRKKYAKIKIKEEVSKKDEVKGDDS